MDDRSKLLFTPKELEEIRKEAERLELEEQKRNVREQLLADARLAVRSKTDPSEETRTVTIDLAEYADRITIDGVIYVHGQTYTVAKRKFDVIAEVMRRTQQHEHEISGKTRAQFKARPPITLRPGLENAPSNALVRAVMS